MLPLKPPHSSVMMLETVDTRLGTFRAYPPAVPMSWDRS